MTGWNADEPHAAHAIHPFRRSGAGTPSTARRTAFHALVNAARTVFEVGPRIRADAPRPFGRLAGAGEDGVAGKSQAKTLDELIGSRLPRREIERRGDVAVAEHAD